MFRHREPEFPSITSQHGFETRKRLLETTNQRPIAILDELTKRSAESQVLDGLQAVFKSESVDDVRLTAARRFLEIVKKLKDWAQAQYADGTKIAERVVRELEATERS